ncbi:MULTISPECIES: OmpA family protein [Ensifer]|uniref:OmpA family protein n=1 Tax=Ensifer canadensis TaxID=555315 RepID=A0AAW4FB59_9HYPH|nr:MULTISPECIES: OmpA family protein [Ensifer]MBM3089372.1 OmpA family protein [Ensifer canadensis]MDP9629924.1 outer membrane protein OmpA-like peptidoglycan-associated protein [Ensifer adhaerens]UBI76706.1 OmpA family protein [Ensifer canadensis]
MKGLIVASAMLLPLAYPARACDALVKTSEALNRGDEVGARAAAAPERTNACSSTEAALTRRVAALATFNRIANAVGAGARLDTFEGELEAVLSDVGGPWQILDALGDIDRERKNYERAATYYQQALEDAANEELTPEWMAPDKAYILRLDRLASEMRLAAIKPVKLAMRGACKFSYRGVSIRKKATPVRYVFGTAEFTPEGLQSAKDLFECLKSAKADAITLIGHTDPIGSAEANLKLSLARAEALANYLVGAGYKGTWTTIGKGEEEPFKPDDPGAYDEAMLHQLDRRVEVDVEK